MRKQGGKFGKNKKQTKFGKCKLLKIFIWKGDEVMATTDEAGEAATTT